MSESPETSTQTQADAPRSVLIVGGGMSGFTLARELRRNGFEGSLTLVDPEGAPYDRPPLSKDYLLGEKDAEAIALIARDWFAENAVEVVTGRATRIDREAGAVELEDGTVLAADRIVLALGGSARRLPVPGGDLDGVLELRTRADADRLRGLLTPGARLAIVGAGLIGAEVASSALKFGAQVTLIDPAEVPLVPAVGEVLARRLHGMHDERGVRTVQGVPESIEEAEGGYRILLVDGAEVEADAVLVGIGIIPNTDLAEDAGLTVDNGILVDEDQRTDDPRILAIGDVARTRLPDGTLLRRAEHWEHAMNTGATAAATILGLERPKHSASWFWSDRHGVHVEGVGSLVGDGTHVHRERDGEVIASFLLDADGRMLGAAAVDDSMTVRAARRIIDRGITVDPDLLKDPDTPLKKLAR